MTLRVLTWISTIISVLSVIPLGEIFIEIYMFFKNGTSDLFKEDICGKVMVFAVLAIIACVGWLLRNIAKKQLRKSLISWLLRGVDKE